MNTRHELSFEHVTKLYRGTYGIQDLSVKLTSGEIAAFIGPNGVGKTTLVKAAAGLLSLSGGSVSLWGQNTKERSCRAEIGYMQSDMSFYEKMTVYEVLDFLNSVKFGGRYFAEIESGLYRYHLHEQRNTRIHQLSLGMKRKLSILMALMGEPKLILLDEPESGVDTSGIIRLKADLTACAARGAFVILTGHVLDFLEKVCTRCIFLKDGRIVKDVSLKEKSVGLETLYEEIYGGN